MCDFCEVPIYVKAVQNTMPLAAPMTRAEELRHELLNLTGEVYLRLPYNYCPICGAKMDGEIQSPSRSSSNSSSPDM